MSKQEIYAWCSLGFTLAIFLYYLISAFGLPSGLENHSDYLTGLIWKVIGITVLIECCLDLLSSTKFGGVHKDERDILIESKGFRNAYYFLIISVIVLIVHVLMYDFLSVAVGEQLVLAIPYMTFHVLVFMVITATIIKSSTQLFYYRVAA